MEEDHAKREVENHGCDPRNPGDIFTCFLIVMIAIYIRTGGIPDTLCTCVFSVCGGECGVMGWIKTTKDRHLSRQYELEDRETDKKESMEETENE